jgi:hypothetical protein
MANVSRPFGFIPKMHRNGMPWNGAVVECYFAAATGTAIGIGDPVILDGSTSTTDAPGVSPYVFAGVASTVYGVVVGFRPNPADLNTTGISRAASTARYALVCPVQDVLFEAQADGALTTVGAAVGKLFEITTDQTVNTATGLSSAQIDATTLNTTTTFPLTIVAPITSPDNDPTLTNAKWLVQFNYPQSVFSTVQLNWN